MRKLICVGAVTETGSDLLRLLPPDPLFHGWESFSPEIGDVVEVRGEPAAELKVPHVEDFRLSAWRGTSQKVPDLSGWISKHCEVWEGSPMFLFEGKLGATHHGTRFLEEGSPLPSGSVGFWRLPFSLAYSETERGYRYVASGEHLFRIKYVGLEESPPRLIPEGKVVRLSLARWYRFEAPKQDGSGEGESRSEQKEKCWLQLSGWY